jgi:tetratricopeptide (TPR) repeat protein
MMLCNRNLPRRIRQVVTDPRRGAFIILFGTRNVVSDEGASATATCPRCSQETSFANKSARRWFTLFFLPVFPVGAKWAFCECGNCRAQFRVSAHELGRKTAAAYQQQTERAIQLYNSMRASPANSVTLNNLMLLYFQLGEFGQAVSAAGEFPEALNASEQCMTTLGRVLMEHKRQTDAIKWFDAAIARNPMLGEAAYCKAVALMSLTPPDLTGAEAAARAARTAGVAEADGLMREIEKRQRGG